jgi:integration host factor subunit beta
VNRSELIALIQQRHPHLLASDVELAVKGLLEQMAETLSTGGRIEIRGFGSFSVRQRAARRARNPRTGEAVQVGAHCRVHFKLGAPLRDRLNNTLTNDQSAD